MAGVLRHCSALLLRCFSLGGQPLTAGTDFPRAKQPGWRAEKPRVVGGDETAHFPRAKQPGWRAEKPRVVRGSKRAQSPESGDMNRFQLARVRSTKPSTTSTDESPAPTAAAMTFASVSTSSRGPAPEKKDTLISK